MTNLKLRIRLSLSITHTQTSLSSVSSSSSFLFAFRATNLQFVFRLQINVINRCYCIVILYSCWFSQLVEMWRLFLCRFLVLLLFCYFWLGVCNKANRFYFLLFLFHSVGFTCFRSLFPFLCHLLFSSRFPHFRFPTLFPLASVFKLTKSEQHSTFSGESLVISSKSLFITWDKCNDNYNNNNKMSWLQ